MYLWVGSINRCRGMHDIMSVQTQESETQRREIGTQTQVETQEIGVQTDLHATHPCFNAVDHSSTTAPTQAQPPAEEKVSASQVSSLTQNIARH